MKRELFNDELLTKLVDKAISLEGSDLYGLASSIAVNYTRTTIKKDDIFLDVQKEKLNYENLFEDPVYNKLGEVYFDNQEKMERGVEKDENKIGNYVLDKIKQLNERIGPDKDEYNYLLNVSKRDLEKKIKESDNVSRLYFFENLDLLGIDFNSSYWR